MLVKLNLPCESTKCKLFTVHVKNNVTVVKSVTNAS